MKPTKLSEAMKLRDSLSSEEYRKLIDLILSGK
jgi:hypothetical protein